MNDKNVDKAVPSHHHWFSQGADRPAYDQVISEVRAVQEAYTQLNCTGDERAIRQLLEERGLHVEESVIRRVMSELPAHPCG